MWCFHSTDAFDIGAEYESYLIGCDDVTEELVTFLRVLLQVCDLVSFAALSALHSLV
jgi:hypothetical protein